MNLSKNTDEKKKENQLPHLITSALNFLKLTALLCTTIISDFEWESTSTLISWVLVKHIMSFNLTFLTYRLAGIISLGFLNVTISLCNHSLYALIYTMQSIK